MYGDEELGWLEPPSQEQEHHQHQQQHQFRQPPPQPPHHPHPPPPCQQRPPPQPAAEARPGSPWQLAMLRVGAVDGKMCKKLATLDNALCGGAAHYGALVQRPLIK